MGLTESLPRRRIVGLLIAIIAIMGVIMALNAGMVSCAGNANGKPRPLSDTELDRLAAMRMNNFGDGRVAITGTIGAGPKLTNVNGWVDWRRAIIYLSATAAGSSALVQARPGVLAIRPGDPANPHTGQPPQQPPPDGWRVRPIRLGGEDKAPLDNLLAFIFLMASDQPDRADLLASLKTQWVRRDSAQGKDVDVLLGPAVLPETSAAPSPSPSASAEPLDFRELDSHGGAVGYWLDDQARLQRVEALLDTGMPATLDFIRDGFMDFTTVDALGGRDNEPRELTQPEATLLSAVRQRDYRTRGAAVTITLPVLPGALRQAKGWIDWQRGIGYLSVQDIDDPSFDILLHANQTTVGIRKTGGRAPDTPPLPAPRGEWERAQWSSLSGTPELTDLDMLIHEALFMGANEIDDAARIRAGARRLRVDVLGGVPVGVFELPNAMEQQVSPPGLARMRYWIDNSGVLRRLEIRTETGGFAQLDLELGVKLPNLPASVS